MAEKKRFGDIEYEVRPENVFAHLELENTEELLAHAQLGILVLKILETRNLKQREISQLLGIAQPEVSHLQNGHFNRFSKNKLFDFLNRLGRKVTIQISPRQEGEPYQEVRAAS